ncbi:cytochrome P450 [Pseudomonas mucidolens]|uniref:cytochrome P450 n=1 Tax=Pseudomonas mucidolens TaxID=46679 RepID=UPI0030DA3CD9
MTPFEAASHADPYVYYANLRQHGDLFFEADLRLWIASGAPAVEAILGHPDCRVRPPHEPVPKAIAQGAAGFIFARLMRMNEGPQHQCPRRVIEPALAALDRQSIADSVARAIQTLDKPFEDLDELMFTLPVSVIASLIGFPFGQLQAIAKLTRDFVACLSPSSNADQLGNADIGATRLSQMFTALLNHPVQGSPFLNQIHNACGAAAWNDRDALKANLIGLLSQTCEATAGLIGNSLIALQRNADLLEGMQLTPRLVAEWVAEVARHDSPVQNTRRFVAKRCAIGDRVLEAGDTVLLLLASANRDPRANPDPDRFLLDRAQRRTFSFGSGRHACPGQQVAVSIACEAISALLHRQPVTSAGLLRWGYRPSLNGRIPQFYRERETPQ